MVGDVSSGEEPKRLRRPATLLSKLPEPLAYTMHPFLVHSGLDRWLLPKEREIVAEALDGYWFKLDPRDEIAREILHFGAYEKRNIEIIRRLVRGLGGTFMDVGANLGNHSILLAADFEQLAVFEPNPPTLARLRANLELNALSKAQVFGIGLSDANVSLPFHAETGTNPGASRFLDVAEKGASRLEVRIGDEVVEAGALGPITAIKVDVEGHEERVIVGLARTIERDQPLVFMEWDARRNGPGCLERLAGYTFHVQPWEMTRRRLWRPFARGIDAGRCPRLVAVTHGDLSDRYVSMLVAVPPGQALSL